jgi:RNA 2',3'-cyclic 3'-phosphodiesterase
MDEEPMTRLFIGLEMPDWVSEELSRLSGGIPGARWMGDDNHHLTLRFVGDVDGYQHEQLENALSGLVGESFTLTLQDIGHFPPRGEAKILWTGVEENEALARLQRRIERIVVRLQFPPDSRKWHPHVTLARLGPGGGHRVQAFLQAHSLLKLEPFLVTSFQLYESHLHPTGSRYEVINSYPLSG